ncbi:MAG TPA: hypothetical protein VNH11_20005 [Pirellulales bacterium]|nr:hypothetical protein [Pirellulales bacterium]
MIAEICALPRDDREAVQRAVSASLAQSDRPAITDEEIADEAYQRQLLAAGLISKIRLRRRDQQAFDQFTPVEIIGKPLSETIIEERR